MTGLEAPDRIGSQNASAQHKPQTSGFQWDYAKQYASASALRTGTVNREY